MSTQFIQKHTEVNCTLKYRRTIAADYVDHTSHVLHGEATTPLERNENKKKNSFPLSDVR